MAIKWTNAAHVVGTLGERFTRRVLDRLKPDGSVRFGETGEGVAPNYQVERVDRPAELFNGRSHDPWSGDVDEFETGNLSKPFARADLNAAFVAAYRKPLGSR